LAAHRCPEVVATAARSRPYLSSSTEEEEDYTIIEQLNLLNKLRNPYCTESNDSLAGLFYRNDLQVARSNPTSRAMGDFLPINSALTGGPRPSASKRKQDQRQYWLTPQVSTAA
jgi:hypothetical protein